MDDFRVWNTRRSNAEITANKDRRLVGTEAGLVLYWNLDEQAGDRALGSSAAAWHGAFGGGLAARRPSRVAGVLGPTDADGDPVSLTAIGAVDVDVSVVANPLVPTPAAPFPGPGAI